MSLIPVHSFALYKRYYDSFMDVFVDGYCASREEGNSQESAFITAKIKLQDHVTTEMLKKNSKVAIIHKVYTNIQKDQRTFEKAIGHFERLKQ